MIRPFTLVCFLLACGAGLYLYSAKHRVQLVDHEIEKTVRATDELREQIRVLHAEWTLQNDPQRLQELANQFLNLKTLTPGQFTSLADLDNRLPAVPAPEPAAPEATEPQSVPVAQAPQPPQPEELPPAPAAARPAVSPPPSRPVAAVAVAAPPVPPPAEHKPPPRPVVAEAPHEHPAPAEVQQVRPTPVVARRVIVAEQPRPAQPTVRPPMTGSALGMARSASAPPPPRPMPVSASQWVGNGGGG
ncbi:MAG: hypothetical protein ACLPKW_22760 [Acetobacteraceae bacterium]